jgi:hypothetical protein
VRVDPTNTDLFVKIGALQEGVNRLRDDFAYSDERAREHREKVSEKLELVSTRTGQLESQMKRLEPTVDSLANLRTKAAGAILVLGAIGAILGYFAGELKGVVLRMFGG